MRAKDINVLIACEESQAECQAFLEIGFNAFSCDIQPCKKGGKPSRHIQGDVTPLLEGKTTFKTLDGKRHKVRKWHLIIAHPPCTYLCKLSSVWMVIDGEIQKERYEKMVQARTFFLKCLNAQSDYLAVENPLPMKRAQLPKPDCYIQPSWFGIKYTKKTLFWLRGLPPIMPQLEYPSPKSFVHSSKGKYRARTFPAVAHALATQWGSFILSELNKK